jgi:hypothetical protein
VRADFGLPYLVFLVFVPTLATLIPAWLFYEATVANIGSPSDDRSTRLRIWFLCSMPALTVCAALVVRATHDPWTAYVSGALLWAFGCFGAFLFAGEPLSPSLRVSAIWQRQGTGRFRQGLGPGILRAALLLLLLTVLALSGNAIVGLSTAKTSADRDSILAFHGYAVAFFCFVAGFTAWARARAQGAGTPRLLLAVALFFAFVGPWIAMAVAGVLTSQHDRAMLLAGPSPTFTAAMVQALASSAPDSGVIVATGSACAAAWALIGVGLFASASMRVRKRLESERQARAALQRAFEEEETVERAALGGAVAQHEA